MVKLCTNTDSRYPERLQNGLHFIPFPKPIMSQSTISVSMCEIQSPGKSIFHRFELPGFWVANTHTQANPRNISFSTHRTLDIHQCIPLISLSLSLSLCLCLCLSVSISVSLCAVSLSPRWSAALPRRTQGAAADRELVEDAGSSKSHRLGKVLEFPPV